ncbi:MAG: hypothetical protein ACTHJ4_00240, partial [Candidatus Nucleicultricaceae bacterium]
MLKISNLRRLLASSLTVLGSVIAGHMGTAHARLAGDDEESQAYHSAIPTRESFFNKKLNDDDLELLEELGLDPVTPSNLDFSETQVELIKQNKKKEDSIIPEKEDKKIQSKTVTSSKAIRKDETIKHTSSATVSNALGEEAPTSFGPLSHERNLLDDLSDNVASKVKSIFTRSRRPEQSDEIIDRASKVARNAKEAEAAVSSLLGEEAPTSFGPLSHERNLLDDLSDNVASKVKSIFTRSRR